MRISKTTYRYLVIALLFFALPAHAEVGMRALGDSLMAFTGFSRVWSPTVRIKQLRVNDNKVTIYTNNTLRDVRWTPENVEELKRKVSVWVLDNEDGDITIYSGNTNIETLITDCARAKKTSSKCKLSADKNCDLTDRTIALWPSHGLYYNPERGGWIWQRATLWTTVEDLYSQEYVRLLRQMLENAGATVVMPRAGLEHSEPGVSGMPQWTEGARYWLKHEKTSSAIWNLYDGNEYKDDMKCRPMWVNSLKTPVDLCLALHTDGQDSGNDSTIIGTLCIYTAKDDDGKTVLQDGQDRETVNRNLADWIQTQLTEDLRYIAPEWTRRQLKEANYCESRVPTIPSVLVEILSHKNLADMKYGLDPKFRFTAARALYKGMLRFLKGYNTIVQPLPVQQLGISRAGLLTWTAPKDPIEPTAKPTYYMVYVQADEGEWDVQQVEKKCELQMDLKRGVRYTIYVVAGNDGGLSMPSPVISAYLSEQEQAPMALIIDAFDDVYGPEWFTDSLYAGIVPGSFACEDRFSCAYIGEQWDFIRSHPWINDDNCGWGACYRDHAGTITIGNTRDWSAQHGRVLRELGISYVSTTAQQITNDQWQKGNGKYDIVDIVCGRQRQPLDTTLQALVSSYLDAGGKLLFSTDHFSVLDSAWTKRYLHAYYYASHASRSGRIFSANKRHYQIELEPNENQLFTPSPEGLKAVGEGAKSMAIYTDMRCPAAVGYQPSASNDSLLTCKTLVFGFPLEAVNNFPRIYRHAINWLLDKSE